MLGRNNAGRYYMHGLLRQYGLEMLNSSLSIKEEIYNQHCLYYTGFLSQRELDLTGAKMYTACNEIRQEMENVRLPLKWALVNWDGEKYRKILLVLLAFYVVHGWQEGKDAFWDIAQARKEALIAQNSPDWSIDPVYLSARIHQAILLCNLGVIGESEAISRECFEPLCMLGLKAELSECLQNLGTNASFRGEYELARERLEEAILIGKESQVFIWPTYLLWLGHTYFLLGEYELGMESFQKCYDLFDHQGNLWGKGFALSKMVLAADGLGDFLQSMQYNHEAFSIFDKTENVTGKAYTISRMSMSAYFLEEYTQAVQYGMEGYQIYLSLGHQWGICTSLCRLGFAYIGQGEILKVKDCFNDALKQSRIYQMTPVSMYALVGMAAALAQEGESKAAVELFQYVQSNPQTPALYLQQASRWIPQLDQELLPDVKTALTLGNNPDGLDEVIDNLNKAWGRHALC
jgi:tetratricopeptide (TPR) repeat protein